MLDVTPLLPLRALRIEMRFTAAAHMRTFHQPALRAWLLGLFDGQWGNEPRVWMAAPESGRALYRRGDRYHFELFCCRGGELRLEALLSRLIKWRAPRDADPRLRIGPNLRFVAARDLFTGSPLGRVSEAFAYDVAALNREVAFYQQVDEVDLQLLAPLRVLKDKGARKKNEERYIRDRGELGGVIFGDRLFDTIAYLLREVGVKTPPRSAVPLRCPHDPVGWYDINYYNASGKSTPMGGLIGALELQVQDAAIWPMLVIGQYLGVGQRRNFGWGRYRLELDGQGTIATRQPEIAIGMRASEAANLELAYRAIRDTKTDRDQDHHGLAVPDLARASHSGPVETLLDGIAEKLRQGRFDSPVLYGAVLRQPGRKPRPLAVPSFEERIAQRAVQQILQSDFESLLSPANYGYRRGLSRINARDRLQTLYRQGYEWLYEADIADFFDTVSHHHLHVRLRSLISDDSIIEQIMDWMGAPVLYRGEQVERHAGLPQGSPLSPLLANLMLDDFDSDLEAMDMQLVRFADDFVVACRSRGDAAAAAEQIKASLAEIDLQINPAKSRITRFDDGFRFLGYTFLGDLVVENARPKVAHQGGPLQLQDLPPASWLAQLARRKPEVLDQVPDAGSPPRRGKVPPEPLMPALIKQGRIPSDQPCMLAVASEPSQLSTRSGRLRIVNPEGKVLEQPWTALGAVLLFGRHKVTLPCLTAALQAGVPVHFAGRGGRYLGSLSDGQPGQAGHTVWLNQQRYFTDTGFVLPLARELVAARINNQRQVLRQRGRQHPQLAQLISAIDALAQRLSEADSLAYLNGIEGAAAQHYFAGLAEVLPSEMGFGGRHRRPPPDPFNAMLSLGYTLLYQRADSVIRSAGLLPAFGIYHRERGRYPALAADFIEPFRHLVERQALAMINRGQLKPDDFRTTGSGCYLNREASIAYLSSLSERFILPMTDATGEHVGTIHEHWWRMARALLRRLQGEAADFRAFHLK